MSGLVFLNEEHTQIQLHEYAEVISVRLDQVKGAVSFEVDACCCQDDQGNWIESGPGFVTIAGWNTYIPVPADSAIEPGSIDIEAAFPGDCELTEVRYSDTKVELLVCHHKLGAIDIDFPFAWCISVFVSDTHHSATEEFKMFTDTFQASGDPRELFKELKQLAWAPIISNAEMIRTKQLYALFTAYTEQKFACYYREHVQIRTEVNEFKRKLRKSRPSLYGELEIHYRSQSRR